MMEGKRGRKIPSQSQAVLPPNENRARFSRIILQSRKDMGQIMALVNPRTTGSTHSRPLRLEEMEQSCQTIENRSKIPHPELNPSKFSSYPLKICLLKDELCNYSPQFLLPIGRIHFNFSDRKLKLVQYVTIYCPHSFLLLFQDSKTT